MNTQLMTLDQAIEKRLASMRQAEAEHERQIEEEARRREKETQRAVEWLCGHLRESEGIEIRPADFARALMDGNSAVNVSFEINGGRVQLQGGIHYSTVSNRFEIIETVGRPWKGVSAGNLSYDYDTFVDAVIYAGRLKR